MSGHANHREQAVAKLLEELARYGWMVTEEKTKDAIAITMSHELSTRRTLVLRTADSRSPEVTVRNFLKRYYSEFRAVGRAPEATPHRALLGELRSAAFAGQWPAAVVISIARLLARHGVLTEAESLWLEDAGVPWLSAQ